MKAISKERKKKAAFSLAVILIVVTVGINVLDHTVTELNEMSEVCSQHNGTLHSGQHNHCVLENGTEWHIAQENDTVVMAELNGIETCHDQWPLGCYNYWLHSLAIFAAMAVIVYILIQIMPARSNHSTTS